MKRICIYCKKKFGCVVGTESKVCGPDCDNNCSQSEDETHGICEPCYPVVRELNRKIREAGNGVLL